MARTNPGRSQVTAFKRISIAAAALLLPLAHTADAHVSLERGEAPRGTSYKAVLKIPHGCDGSATHTVRVEIPEGYIGVKPMPKPGWTIKTTRGAYAEAHAFYHGKSLTEGVKEIEWSGGDLPDDYYDEFVANGFLAKELAPGASLYFKVVQVCAKGEERWVDVPAAGQDPHDLAAPAAVLKIADAGDHAHGHDHGGEAKAAAANDGTTKIGSLVIEGAWTRATAEGAKVGAGYLTIRNTGSAADTLVSVETPVAGRGEIHDMTMTDGVMRMRRLAGGLEIPAGGTAELKPGGMHLMLMDLKAPLVEGGHVPVKLTFKSGAAGEVVLSVKPLGAKSGDGGGHSHH
jgi:uncharacterized protein YcnI/copper(I)-binding protein